MAYSRPMYVPLPVAFDRMSLGDNWCWENFLKPLKSCPEPTLSSRNLDLKPGKDNSTLASRFRQELIKQHCYTYEEKESEEQKAKADLNLLMNEYCLSSEDFENLKKCWRNYEKARNIKSDLEKTGSTWTVAMLKNYIRRQDIVFVQPESRFDLIEEEFRKIFKMVDSSIKAIAGRNADVEDLSELYNLLMSTESDTKMILDALLQPLCVFMGLTVRSEQTLKSDELPTNRYDFIIYDVCYRPIGVVEAKRRGCLKEQSVAQLIVQLLLLSAEAPDWFYFGILSDAYQFIFAGVTREKVVFFQTNVDMLKTETVSSNDDLRFIVDRISWLMELALQTRITNQSIDKNLIESPVKGCLKVDRRFLGF